MQQGTLDVFRRHLLAESIKLFIFDQRAV